MGVLGTVRDALLDGRYEKRLELSQRFHFENN